MKVDFNSALLLLDVFPNQKRTVTAFFALGMLVCQMGGFHTFTGGEWAGVGVTGAIFYHLKLLRDDKEKKEKLEQEELNV